MPMTRPGELRARPRTLRRARAMRLIRSRPTTMMLCEILTREPATRAELRFCTVLNCGGNHHAGFVARPRSHISNEQHDC